MYRNVIQYDPDTGIRSTQPPPVFTQPIDITAFVPLPTIPPDASFAFQGNPVALLPGVAAPAHQQSAGEQVYLGLPLTQVFGCSESVAATADAVDGLAFSSVSGGPTTCTHIGC